MEITNGKPRINDISEKKKEMSIKLRLLVNL